MQWKQFARQYLGFTRRERLAILVLVSLILLVYITPTFISSGKKPVPQPADTAWISSLRKLEQEERAKEKNSYPEREKANSSHYTYDRPKHSDRTGGRTELFPFDPNTLSGEGWKRLGLRDKTIQTIQNYLSKGGRFRKPGDLQRIYGLFPDEFERIAPYIRIASTTAGMDEKGDAMEEIKTPKAVSPRYTIIDINTADTTAFISLPGIGSKLSARIVSFREKLGGFYSVSQVAEIYGLPDSTFQKIKQYLKLENMGLRKININTATLDELKAHPYIRYHLANPIVAYRKEHGPFLKVEDLKKVMAVTEEVFHKVSPYLSL